jgi:hypothetical protein
VITALTVFISSSSLADDAASHSGWTDDRFSFAVGGFFASTETQLRDDATDGSGGTKIDYQQAL